MTDLPEICALSTLTLRKVSFDPVSLSGMAERGPYSKGRQRREAILESTLTVFSELGSRKASMRAIADDVGISPALLQYYFSSREELLLEVIHKWDMLNAQRGAGMTHFAHWLAAIRHNALVPGIVHLYMTCVIEATDPGHPGRPFYKERYEMLTRKIVGELLLQQRNGTLPPEAEPERIARMLLAASEGIQIRWLHEPDFDMFEEFLFLLKQFDIVIPELQNSETVDPRLAR
jgi:AcrR family transcriptional regulator